MRRLFLSLCLLGLVALAHSAQALSGSETSRREVDFGVNGHPLNTGTYTNISLETQLSLLRTLRLTTYRVNVNPNDPEKYDRLFQLVSLAQRDDIRVLPVIVLPPSKYSSEDAAYDHAKAVVSQLARQFDGRIRVWELGNEYDLYCVKKDADGSSPADYEPEKYAVVRGLITGMLAGLREGSPSARSIVQTSQHTPTALDSGFLQRLIDDGVMFDITGYHYYSTTGHVPTTKDGTKTLKVLHDQFHKPILITEFDKSSISPTLGPSSDPKEQGRALRTALSEIAADAEKYDVLGADIYELLDQPALLNNPGVQPCQARFGILDSHGDPTEASEAVQQFLRAY